MRTSVKVGQMKAIWNKFNALPAWALAGIVTFAVMALTLLLFGSQYQTNDDYAMNLIAAGAYGQPDAMLVFSNIMLGEALAWLYGALPSINWYAWLHLALLFVSSAILVYFILDTVPKRLRLLAAVLFLGAGTVPAAMQLQFTLQAYFLAAAGFAGFAYAFFSLNARDKRGKRTALLVLAVLLCTLSVMVRDKAILTLAPFFVLAVGYLVYKKDRRPILWLLIACAACAGVLAADAAAYRGDGWQAYFEFNAARSELLDSPRLDYSDNADVFSAVGWSETDYEVFYAWMLADEEKFTTQNLEYILEHGRWNPVTPGSLVTDFAASMDAVLKFYPFCILLLCLGLCLKTRRDKLLPLLITAAVLAAHAAFVVMQRAPVRTVFPHYVLGILFLLLLVDYGAFRLVLRPRRGAARDAQGDRNAACTALLAVFAAVVLMMTCAIRETTYNWNGSAYAYYRELDDYIAQNPDKLFLSSVIAGGDRFRAYSVFEAPRTGALRNFSLLGGWYTKSPRYYEFMAAHGIGNMFLSLVRTEGVYLIDRGEPELIQEYLAESYGIQTEAIEVEDFDDCAVYRLVRKS